MLDTPGVFVVGIGNPDCGDDGAGHLIIDRLKRDGTLRARTIKLSGEAAGLVEVFSGNQTTILVDAIATVAKPGTIHRFDAGSAPLPSEVFSSFSTHGMGVAEAVEIARALGNLPVKTIVYGIEGLHFEPGSRMCSEMLQNLDDLVERIRAEISHL